MFYSRYSEHMPGYVYLLANRKNGAHYLGHTANIGVRTWSHKLGVGSKFTAKYDVHRLVWFSYFEDIRDAAHKETQMKKWHRAWKVNLLEQENPNWDDLFHKLNN